MMAADAKGQKFSLHVYAAEMRQSRLTPDTAGSVEEPTSKLQLYADEVRHMLAAPRGWSDEERRNYAEKLNRAIIGFPRERAEMLAIISDWIIRRRLQHVAYSNLPYEGLAEALFAEVIGLNVLELILRNRDDLEEIQVIGTRIFEVRDGKAVPSPYHFRDIGQVERIQQNLVLFNNDRINPRKRWAEVVLLDGSRVTMTGFGFTAQPTMTIRLYKVRQFSLHTLCQPAYRTLDDRVRCLLTALIIGRFNMVVIGATNTGKTHLIKAIIAEMPDHERLITIEGRFELMLARDFPNKNVVEYETDEEEAVHSARQAFKLALRQSPQRICHAEIRDEDANIYVRACTRGHEGSITSVHASSLEDVPDAITDMCMQDSRGMNAQRMTKRITEQVTHIGLEMRMVNNIRKLVRIGEYEWHNGDIRIRDLVRYEPVVDTWHFPESLSVRGRDRMNRWHPDGLREFDQLESDAK